MRLVIIIVVGLVVAFILVVLLGAVTVLGTTKKTTTTTAARANSPTQTYASPNPPTTERRTTTTAAPVHVPTPEDFTLEVIETKRSCFGSAGCNVTYKVIPSYNGPPPSSSKTYTIIYEVTGGDDVKSNNFTMKGTDAKVPSEEFISTSANTPISAAVTRVV